MCSPTSPPYAAPTGPTAAAPVSGDDLDAAIAAAGVTFEPGDALLLRMGRDAYEAAGHVYASSVGDPPPPGIGWSGAEWIADHHASIVGWDFLDSSHPSEPPGAVHSLIWAIGLVLIDNCDYGAARGPRSPPPRRPLGSWSSHRCASPEAPAAW